MKSIQAVKEYWNLNPCNFKLGEYRYKIEPHILKFADFSKWKGKKVLEIGCGTGIDTINFAKAGVKITTIDLSDESLKIAKEKASGLDIKFYRGNAEELSKHIPVEPYDLIYSFGVIHHTPNPEKIIGEIKKYCDRNTTVKIMLYYRYSWPVLWIMLRHLTLNIAKYTESGDCPITKLYSKRGVKRLLKDFNINIKIAYDITEANHFPKWLRFIKPIARPFGWHLLITAVKK